jgi:hypothetical protein
MEKLNFIRSRSYCQTQHQNTSPSPGVIAFTDNTRYYPPMNIQELQTHATLYKVALLLNISPPAVYKWKKSGIPALRLYQLKEMKPEWFERKEHE